MKVKLKCETDEVGVCVPEVGGPPWGLLISARTRCFGTYESEKKIQIDRIVREELNDEKSPAYRKLKLTVVKDAEKSKRKEILKEIQTAPEKFASYGHVASLGKEKKKFKTAFLKLFQGLSEQVATEPLRISDLVEKEARFFDEVNGISTLPNEVPFHRTFWSTLEDFGVPIDEFLLVHADHLPSNGHAKRQDAEQTSSGLFDEATILAEAKERLLKKLAESLRETTSTTELLQDLNRLEKRFCSSEQPFWVLSEGKYASVVDLVVRSPFGSLLDCFAAEMAPVVRAVQCLSREKIDSTADLEDQIRQLLPTSFPDH